jgi:hypothetical protein
MRSSSVASSRSAKAAVLNSQAVFEAWPGESRHRVQ